MFSFTNSKQKRYFLHSKLAQLASGERRIYYFAKTVTPEFALADVPQGYEPFESKNGLPFLRKIKSTVLA